MLSTILLTLTVLWEKTTGRCSEKTKGYALLALIVLLYGIAGHIDTTTGA